MFHHVAFNLSYGYSIAKLSLYTKSCIVKGHNKSSEHILATEM